MEDNARLVRAGAVEEVERLKAEPGGNLAVGGAGLAATFIRAGLVDEFGLFVKPVVLGDGTPFFPALEGRWGSSWWRHGHWFERCVLTLPPDLAESPFLTQGGRIASPSHRRKSTARPVAAVVATLCSAALIAASASAGSGVSTAVFGTAGEHQYVVPSGIHMIYVTATGARGGTGYSPVGDTATGGAGGVGGRISAEIPVTPGQTLYVEIGGDGFPNTSGGSATGGGNGGGLATGGGGGGGGASDIRTCPADACPDNTDSTPTRLLVAAGGGGGGRNWDSMGFSGAGGTGGAGGMDGGTGDGFGSYGGGGGGGHAASQAGPGGGGAAGPGNPSSGDVVGSPGSPGGGPDGGQGAAGGGGGGGYFGGGSGGTGAYIYNAGVAAGGGGGGGSSWATAGSRNATSGIASSGDGASITITPGPTADATPTALDFGDQTVGGASAAKTITVSNHGGEPLEVDSMSIGGPGSADFYITGTRCGVVDVGQSCTATLRFVPQAAGSRAATLDLASNADTAPATVALSGNGTAPPATVGSPSQTPQTPQTQTTGLVTKLLLFFVDPKLTARTHHRVRVPYISTMRANAILTLRRGKSVVARVYRVARAGRNSISWNGRVGRRFARAGRYTLTLTAAAGTQHRSASLPLRLK